MLSRRERRFADRQADKLIAQLKRDNKLIILSQPTMIQPMKVDDKMLNKYKNGMQLQETTGNTEPSTNAGTTNT